MTKEKQVWFVFGALALVGLLQTACGAKQSQPPQDGQQPAATEDQACAPEQLAKIESAYLAEATEACAGKTYDNCEALPAIREKYKAKREAWKACGQ